MSIFSKLSGTMERVFTLGKRGIKLSNDNNELKVENNEGTDLVPVSGASPLKNTHFVTLDYFNTHSGGGPGSDILKGIDDPDSSLGVDGSVYFKVDGTKVLAIYIKDGGTWKAYEQSTSPNLPNFKKPINNSDWTDNGSGGFSLVIGIAEHQEGVNIMFDVYENTIAGSTSNAPFRKTLVEGIVSSNGDINLTSTSAFSGEIVVSGK